MSFGAGAGDVVEIRSKSGQVTTFNNSDGVILLAPEAEDILIKIGNVYKALGQNKAALKSYEQALEIVRNGEDNLLKEQEILSNIASVYENLQYQSALESYQELLANSLSRTEKESLLNSIGTVYKNLGQYQAALESYEQALAIVREQKQRSPNVNTNNQEGAILVSVFIRVYLRFQISQNLLFG